MISYRALKKLVGETSLERKCRFLFGAALLILITASFWLYANRTRALVENQQVITARSLVDRILQIRHYQEFVKQTQGESETNESLKPPAENDNVESTSPQGVLILGENASIRDQVNEFDKSIVELPQSSLAMTWNLLDLDTSFPESDAGFQAIDIFEDPDREDDEHWVFREDDQGTRELVYFAAIRPNPSCLKCHQPPPYHRHSAGEALSASSAMDSPVNSAESDKENARRNTLMGMVRVGLSMETVEAQLSRNKAILLASAIVTSFLAMMAAYAIVRYIIVKPVLHLKDVSDEIARGNLNLRADINTGDEFEELSHAFNRMLRHMMTVNDELRSLNESLDGKVDQLAQANMELFNNNKLKDDFLATMSHELRTPLNSILGFSDILQSAVNLDERQKRYVHNIQTSGRSLMVQINDLLDLAKIESGKMDLHLSEVLLPEIIELQVQQVMPLADRRNIDLRIEPCLSQIPVLHQDRGKIMQILNNLLSNAIKFTPEGGRVRVGSRMFDSDFFEFSVEDTGIGIPLHEQEHIFEKFRQGTTNPGERDHVTREYEGTGLGLSIVRELARLLGGDVHLQSEFGKGSLFSVRLPVTATDRRLEKHPPLESRSGSGLGGITSTDLMGTRPSESVVTADAK